MGKISEEINALKGLVESLKKPGVTSRPSTASTAVSEKPKPAPITARVPASKPTPTLKKDISTKSGEESKSNLSGSRPSSPNAAKTNGVSKISKVVNAVSAAGGFGLKRPSTAIGVTKPIADKTQSNSTEEPSSASTTTKPQTGIKAPQAIKKPAEVTKAAVQEKLKKEIKSEIEKAEEKVKSTPGRSKVSAVPAGPKSSETDELDDIYKEDDPIGISIEKRKKQGSLTSQVKEESKSGKFFFTLRQTGD